MAGEQKSIFHAPSIAFITGASAGIGRAIAREFATRFTDKLHLVLTGRSEKNLEETVSLIKAEPSFSATKTTFKLVIGNLEDKNEFAGLLDELFNIEDASSSYQHAILVNNAGSAGDVTKYIRDFTSSDAGYIQDYFFLNVSSALLLASKFISVFPKSDDEQSRRRQFIIQITSLAAELPTPCWSLYCTGKAARDMLHKVIAAEEPTARVLCYAPGPVDTAMLHHMKDNSTDAKTAKLMNDCYKVCVTPQKTASVLCNVLHEDKYESGAHVDLFDIIGPPKSD